MYKHILLPTDGSPLSEAAGRQAVAFAKSINARVTGITCSRPFHTLALEAQMVTDTRSSTKRTALRELKSTSGCSRSSPTPTVSHSRAFTL